MTAGGRSLFPLDIRPLKEFARKRLPSDSSLRHAICSEDDHLLPDEFLARLPVWLSVCDLELGGW